MGDISVIEFLVFGFIAYSSLLMLIISTIKEVPTTKASSIVRAIFLIPGIICAAVLAGSGTSIITDTVTTTNTIRNVNTTEVWTETTTQDKSIELQSTVWITVHQMIFLVLIVYVINQIFILFTKKK